MCPPKIYVQVITGVCECDLVWKQAHCRCSWLKMRSNQSSLGPLSNMSVALMKRGEVAQKKRQCRDTQADGQMMRDAETGGMHV